jgi:hypothetical protein
VTYRAVNAVVDKASVIVAEDLSRTFTGRRKRGADTNRRWAAWTKGVTAEALRNVSGRGSAVRLVNAAYTSQVILGTRLFGRRVGDRLSCPHPGRVVWHAEDAAAITVLDRAADADIGLYTPHWRVKQITGDRADRPRSRLPDQDQHRRSLPVWRAKHLIPINTDHGIGSRGGDPFSSPFGHHRGCRRGDRCRRRDRRRRSTAPTQ